LRQFKDRHRLHAQTLITLQKASFFQALKWSIAGELASRAIQPLVFIVLARLLNPTDYGVVAAAMMVISFTQVFWEAGLSKALIQRQTHVEEASNVTFWVNLCGGVLIAVIVYLCADLIAIKLFQDARVGDVLRVMTLQIFLGALASVHNALLQKEMKFNRLFWVRISTVAIPALFSIPLAWYGFSYWALVVGTLVGQVAQVIVLWTIYKWRPGFTFHKSVAREMARFGVWVGLTGLLTWFYLWVDSLFIGSYLGTHQLGIYRTGNQFVIMIFGLLFTPLLPVLYSNFSLIQDDRERLKQAFFKVVRIIAFVAIPLAFGILALASPASQIVFGEEWKGIELVIGVMALVQGFSWVVGANGEVYRAIGKPSYETVVNSISLFIYLPAYIISIQYGFETFIWTRFALAMVALIFHLYLGWLAIKLSAVALIKVTVLASIAGAFALLIQIPVEKFIENPFLQIVITTGTGGILILVFIFVIERNGLVTDLKNLITRRKAS
jgi:PST family polysaccharide transporter